MGRRAQGVRLVVVAVLALLNAGWGAEGHRITGRIAQTRISDETRKALADLIGGQTLAQASTWADEIKSDSSWDWARPLHYVNIPVDADTFLTERDCADGVCVVAAIDRYAAVLADPAAPRGERIVALKFLVHFVGDLHQPLHAGYQADLGGNRLKLTFLGRQTNLHRMWDTDMLRRSMTNGWSAYADRLLAGLDEDAAKTMAADLSASSWADESFDIVRNRAYELPRDRMVGQAYYDRNIGVVDARLTAAGVRLAAMLDDILAGAATTPDADPAAEPAETPDSFVEITLDGTCGPDGGRHAYLVNRHATKTIDVTVRKSWTNDDRPMTRDQRVTIHPGDGRKRRLGCTHGRISGGNVRVFGWEIVSAKWRDR